MTQSRLLVDSNSYFRLARSIHPLLGVVFGDENYCLYVLPDLEKEYGRSARLRTKFHWVNDDQYVQNRKHTIAVSKKEKKEIDRAREIIDDYKYENCLGVSSIDIHYLANAYVLSIPVVTDDDDMLELASVFDIRIMKSLKLLALMLEAKHISIKKVREIVAYWKYEKDTPGNYRQEYKKLFKENAS